MISCVVDLLVNLGQGNLVDHLVDHAAKRRDQTTSVRVCKQQDRLLPLTHNPHAKRLIVFTMPTKAPGRAVVSGGIVSIINLCDEAERLRSIHDSEVCMCVFPGCPPLIKCEWFENDQMVFRFDQLREFFRDVDSVMLHLPEVVTNQFLASITEPDLNWLKSMDSLHINILNQNIQLMPAPDELDPLKQIATRLTITTAHKKYCTAEERIRFGVPLHYLSTPKTKYEFREYPAKENLLIYSPDLHPLKAATLKVLSAIPGLKCIEIQNMTFEQYKKTIARAKWALTFGEGLDGYFVEPISSGAISFAVYHPAFMTHEYQQLQTVYPSYQLLIERIAADIARLDHPEEFVSYQREQFELLNRENSQKEYLENVARFYQQDYTFP